MRDLKQKIKNLRLSGMSYNEISAKLGCSKGTIAYHCNDTTKNKATISQKHRRTMKSSESFKQEIKKVKDFCPSCQNPLLKNNTKYCSNKCQRNYTFTKEYSLWIKGELKRIIGVAWLKKAVTHLHGYKCSCCNLESWMESLIVLELDHINGDSTDNSVENLRLLCPNCHSQTPTYKAKNKGRGRSFRRKNHVTS